MDELHLDDEKLTNKLAYQSFFRPDKKIKLDKIYPADGLYELATHSVKVKRTGTVGDIATLWDLEGY